MPFPEIAIRLKRLAHGEGLPLPAYATAHAAGMVGMAALWGYLGGADVDTWGADVQVHQPAHVLTWLADRHRQEGA